MHACACSLNAEGDMYLNTRYLALHFYECSIGKPHVVGGAENSHLCSCRAQCLGFLVHCTVMHFILANKGTSLRDTLSSPADEGACKFIKQSRMLTKVLQKPPVSRAAQVNKLMLCQGESIHSRPPLQETQCCPQGVGLKS